MKIIVDREGLEKVSQLVDICLKSRGTQGYALATEVLSKMEIMPSLIPDKKEAEGKEAEGKDQAEPKTKK